ncbi:hypothetical protein BD413DRAFT_307432 [Trametes elegans]|nr:hypothetical protein BD413DRAFT_307432 [Trametes elegans]
MEDCALVPLCARVSSTGEHSTALAADLDQNALLIADERRDGLNASEAQVAIWRLSSEAGAPEKGIPSLVTSFSTPTQLAANPWSKGTAKAGYQASRDSEIVSLHVLLDSHALVVITRVGDITTIALDEDTPSL